LDDYRQLVARKRLVGLSLFFLLALLWFVSVRTGSLALPELEVLRSLIHFDRGGRLGYVIWNIRLPRTLGAMAAGASLGVAGVVMQNILRNPLASPFTIGVSQGAAFGAAFAIIVLGAGEAHRAGNAGVTVSSPQLIVLSAFGGSLLSVIAILLLSSLKNVSTESVILAGVALSAFFGAATMLLQYFADDMQMAASVFWTFGDLGKAGWLETAVISLFLLITSAYFILGSWNFNALAWGDEVAASLGVRVKALRVGAMVCSALVVAVSTSFLGIIGFVGLMAPHLMRLLVGNDHRFLVPASALAGALLLLAADIIARTIMAPVVLPVGIITSFIGAPLFLFLLVRGHRG